MIRIFMFLCITAVIAAERIKIHEEMTEDERFSQFGPDFSEDTPYEVTLIAHQKHPESPQHRILQLTSFEQDLKFYLEPTDGYLAGVNTPIFKAKKKLGEMNNVRFKRLPSTILGKYKIYQDPVNNGSFVIHNDENDYPLVNGVIDLKHTNEKLIIHPLLYRFHKYFGRQKRDANDYDDDYELFTSNSTTKPNSGLEYTHHHVVYKVSNKRRTEKKDYEDEDNEYSWENENIDEALGDDETDSYEDLNDDDEGHTHIDLVAFSRGAKEPDANNTVPQIVYPQVLIIVESSYFKRFKRNVNKIIEYLLAFWNAVDLRYRVYQNPEIRLNIAGIILAEDSAMTPYLTKNSLFIKTLAYNKISVDQALRDKSQFMYPETERNETDQTLTMKRLNVKYDIVITMTTLDVCSLPVECANEHNEFICDIEEATGTCETMGYAYVDGGCAYDPSYQEMEAIGIIEDKGSFAAIVPTAHEIGHLLGASHANDNEDDCEGQDGYLMSGKLIPTEKSFVWSNCTAGMVKNFFKKKARAQCMFNKPNTGNRIARTLPGKMYSRDQICHRAVGTRSCRDKWYSKRCDVLYCKDPKKKNSCTNVANHLVPEGAPCGYNSHCINGYCLHKSNNTVNLHLGTTPQPEEDYMEGDES